MPDIFDDLFGPKPQDKPKAAPPAKGMLRPSFVKKAVINVDQWFDIDALWEYVKTQMKTAPRGSKIELPVAQITHPGLDEASAAIETARFFGKERDIEGLDSKMAWNRLTPTLDDIEEVLNNKKPSDLRGRLRFDVAPDSSLTLFYVDK